MIKNIKQIIPDSVKASIKKLYKSLKQVLKSTLEKKSTKHNIQTTFPTFQPASSGNYKMYENSIINNINSILPILSQISKLKRTLDIIDVDDLNVEIEHVEYLGKLFKKYKSDKSTSHDYHKIYSHYIGKKDNFVLVEIGIGTNNEDVISNMSNKGNPGASLYAFSDAYPNSKIIGCDVDKRVLFDEKNIVTYFLDQNDFKTYEILSIYKNNIDYLIDDGLHSQSANLNTLLFSLENLSKGGILFIEDIPEYALNVWQVVSNSISSDFKFEMIKCKIAYCGVLEKLK